MSVCSPLIVAVASTHKAGAATTNAIGAGYTDYKQMNELDEARLERDEAWKELVTHRQKVDAHAQKVIAARARFVLARSAVAALEQDAMAYPTLV
jgi:hypothetical protein